MLSVVASASLVGLEASIIHVEVDVSPYGLPYTKIVGLPARVVQESKERVRSAIRNSGVSIQARKTTINLSPASLPKQQSYFDLPIAVGILQGHQKIPSVPKNTLFIGELSLDGMLRPVRGASAIATLAHKKGFTRLVFPMQNMPELQIIDGIDLLPTNSLKEVVEHLRGTTLLSPSKPAVMPTKTVPSYTKAVFPRGNLIAKRAIQISLAGNHHLLLYGIPGTGKTMIAGSVPHLLLPLTQQERAEVTTIHSATGTLKNNMPTVFPPFQAPHHTMTEKELLGGGAHNLPGEITLAHRGILFLDEFSEFSQSCLNSLRQPLEKGEIELEHQGTHQHLPCQFTLIAATNLCPCGYFGSKRKICRCSASEISRYRKKISGPLLDRIDMQVEMDEFQSRDVLYDKVDAVFMHAIENAKKLQRQRYANTPIHANGELTAVTAEQYCLLSTDAKKLLHLGSNRLQFSMRKYLSAMRLARTIADLANTKTIQKEHVAEALQLSRNLSFNA